MAQAPPGVLAGRRLHAGRPKSLSAVPQDSPQTLMCLRQRRQTHPRHASAASDARKRAGGPGAPAARGKMTNLSDLAAKIVAESRRASAADCAGPIARGVERLRGQIRDARLRTSSRADGQRGALLLAGSVISRELTRCHLSIQPGLFSSRRIPGLCYPMKTPLSRKAGCLIRQQFAILSVNAESLRFIHTDAAKGR
ncbi:hypothetical protein ACVJGD_004589 [Bradyrhizobium sp. USDA 10063]